MQQRCLLALLLLTPNRPVDTERIVDALWGDNPPRSARNSLQQRVTGLRLLLPADVRLVHQDPGYVITAAESDIDLFRFRDLVSQARQERDPAVAVTRLRAALALWRGEPLADARCSGLDAVRIRLVEERMAAWEDCLERELALGRGAELVPELTALAAEHPLRERLQAQLMQALHRAGRTSEALAAFQAARERLADELGIDPGRELLAMEQQILSPPRTVVPQQLPGVTRWFTGRDDELALLDGARVCAIDGGAGVGKTALAVAWAHRNLDRFPDGQLFVDLHGFDSEEPVRDALHGLLVALGVDDVPLTDEAKAALYQRMVADKRLLVVLDNAFDVDQIRPLLPVSSTCTVVITSRRALTGLAVTHDAHVVPVDPLPQKHALAMFTARVGARRAAEDPDAVSELVGYCAGLPLALAIVAARAVQQPRHPLARFAAELREESTRLQALRAWGAAADLRTVFASSFAALTEKQRRAFALLSKGSGEFGLEEAAELSGLPASEIRSVLRELEAVSLVSEHQLGRYRMHELVRLAARASHGLGMR
ncbi:AfsR/SARP family transcriptional regulator [Allokutzneria oryzae]|uniref:BTAD domain-containing putative transcriptional regulator n=1 Tax=Allokutzneria oryzae TaxID=1378989 RepID=A0ABV5ZRL2_9PSEU